MKKLLLSVMAIIFVGVVLTQPANAAAQWDNKTIVAMLAINGDDCIYFKLTGVTQADPIVANNPWFAFSQTDAAGKAMLAALMSTKALAATVTVVTTGGTVCGNAKVGNITW